MRSRARLSWVLQDGGFRLNRTVERLAGRGLHKQSWLLALTTAGLLLSGAALDGSLILSGRDVGLLEHPTLWAFIAMQVVLPLTIRASLVQLLRAKHTTLGPAIRRAGGIHQALVAPLIQFSKLENRFSRRVATALYLTGVTAFVWNSYQNQLPRVIVPYDFWDSTTFKWSFWLTRVYKLYLFAWFFPYVGLLQVGVVAVTLRLIRRARLAGHLDLEPFHSDGVGGLGFVPTLVTRPLIISLVMAFIATAGAFFIHRDVDLTPLIGTVVVVAIVSVSYIIPIAYLRTDIVALKTRMIERLRLLQESYLTTVLRDPACDLHEIQRANEALAYFDKVGARVRAISNYPHLRRLTAAAGLAFTPVVVPMIAKAVGAAVPAILGHFAKQP